MGEKICKVRHAKALGYCAKGMRAFFRVHGLDYVRFVREGLTPQELLAMDDAMATKVVELAMAERDK